jgi:hypothetical protein
MVSIFLLFASRYGAAGWCNVVNYSPHFFAGENISRASEGAAV